MNTKVLHLRQALEKLNLYGQWTIEYTDRTHLNDGVFITIGKIRTEEEKNSAAKNRPPRFWFRPVLDEELRKNIESAQDLKQQISEKGGEHLLNRAVRVVRQEINESVMRAGILPPVIKVDDFERLEQEPYFTAVTDTGALRRGVITYFHRHFAGRKPIWTTIPTVSMMEIQDRAEHLASEDRKALRRVEAGEQAKFKNIDVLRIRPLVTCSMWEVAALRASYPVDYLSLDPSLVRQFPSLTPETIEAGPEKNFIQDRLIIESVKTLKRERAIDKGLYIITSDKSMASFAEAENISSIYVEVPALPSEIYSMHFDPYRQTFLACPLPQFLWDLTAVFSRIRLTRTDNDSKLELTYYHVQRQKLLDDRLEVTTDGPDFAPSTA